MALTKVRTGGITADAITAPEIADGAIVTAAIADDAVTSAKMPEGPRFKIATSTASNSTSLAFTTTGYKTYIMEIVGLVAATDGADFKLEFSVDSGSNYLTGGVYGSSLSMRMDSAAVTSVVNDSNNAGFLTVGLPVDSTTTVGSSYEIYMPNVNQQTLSGHRLNGWWRSSGYTNNNLISHQYAGFHLTGTAAINNIKFSMSSGNIATGVFNLWGINAV